MNPQTSRADALTRFLRDSIPLTHALDVRVTEASEGRVRLVAPLTPNLNHHGTAFGGSLATVGILAGWTLLHMSLEDAGVPASLVVRHVELDYLEPVNGDLIADSVLPLQDWPRFVEVLQRGRRARIDVESTLRGNADAVRVKASYVALPPP
jgi:thioesterase domain-containing protein